MLVHAHVYMYQYLTVPAAEHVAKGHLSEMSATCQQELVGTLVGSGPTCCTCVGVRVHPGTLTTNIQTYARTHMLLVGFPKVPQRVCVHVIIFSYLE